MSPGNSNLTITRINSNKKYVKAVRTIKKEKMIMEVLNNSDFFDISTGNEYLNEMLSTLSKNASLGMKAANTLKDDVFFHAGEMLGYCIREMFERTYENGISKTGRFIVSDGKDTGMFSINIISGVENEHLSIKFTDKKKIDTGNDVLDFIDGFCRGIRSSVKAILYSKGAREYNLMIAKAIGASIKQIMVD